jgi:hypothetical protein
VPNDKYSFVVRIWKEAAEVPEAPEAALWRGSIDDVGSGARSYFGNLDEISELIRRKLGAERDGSKQDPFVEGIKEDHEQ